MSADLDARQLIVVGEVAYILLFILGVVLHEAGHAIAARLAGLDLRLVSIGRGPALLHARYAGTAFVLRAVPLTGYVAIAVRPGMSPRRYAAMVAAGPGVNLGLLLAAYAADEVAPYYDALLMPAMIAQGLILLLTLVPFRLKARGGIRASDGMQLWTNLATTPPDLFAIQYAAVMALVLPGQPAPLPSPSAPELIYQVVRSDRALDAWGARDAAAAVRPLLARPDLTPAERAVALDFLAGSEVLFGATGATPPELDTWSAEACTLAPGIPTTLTRAGVLATTGHAGKAMELLSALPEPDGTGPVVAVFRYWLHMAQAAAACGQDENAASALASARKAANGKGPQRPVMRRILARAHRQPPLNAST